MKMSESCNDQRDLACSSRPEIPDANPRSDMRLVLSTDFRNSSDEATFGGSRRFQQACNALRIKSSSSTIATS